MKNFTRDFFRHLPAVIAVCILSFAYFSATAQQNAKSILFTQSSQNAEVEQGKTQSLLEYISTSNNSPVSVQLKAVDNTNHLPVWLSVNGNNLDGISYTAGSEISFDFDATNLSIGTYYATVTATAPGYTNAVLNFKLSVTSGSTGNLANFKVNFQDSATKTPEGWLRDFGQPLGPRSAAYQDNGYTYGWIKRSDKTPFSLTKNGRKRNAPSDILLATLIHMQGNDVSNFKGSKTEGVWEAQVTNGNYEVTVSVGDGEQTDSKHSINIEGISAISKFAPTAGSRFKTATVIVSVNDNYLTVDAEGGTNTKINWIIIKPYSGKRPTVVSVNPENSAINVSENTSISTGVLQLPNSGINNATLTKDNVFLTEVATGAVIPSNVNGTGGGDAITLVPTSPLKPGTTYRFTITSGVKDLSDSVFIPHCSTFTTGTSLSASQSDVQFDKVDLPTATGQHSSLTIGPDGKLYALSIDGIIKRFTINPDGTLSKPQLIYSLQDKYGSRTPRLAVGFAFDPSATATNLVAWVTHDSFVFLNAPDWDGKLSRLSGPNLETVQDVVINLPRSKKDHVTNSIAFGPDGALYFTQGSMSAMGKADKTWGNRAEHLLSAAVLRLDVSKLGSLPLDVKTAEGGGSYNPYNRNAPLTIYASGVRNAYDLVWHSNGNLYVPTNSSAAGGNTPASVNGTLRPDGSFYNGPSVPALTNIQQTPTDFLFKIAKGGYYGHPNALRGEYVLNGGNPTSPIDPAQVKDYPLGVKPDPNYRGYAFDFQLHASPNGAIEYKSNTFNGALKGRLMVVRYSQHKDIMTLTAGGAEKNIISSTEGYQIEGFSGFNDPIDLTEDTSKGNIYVSEYGGDGKITLLRPRAILKVASTKTIYPNADATIRNGVYAGVNYGSDTTLVVKGTEATGMLRSAYLKFPLDSVNSVSRAVLRVYGKNTENFALINIAAFGVDNDDWTEKNITWNNAPAVTTSAEGSVMVNNELKYYEIDVTKFVKAQLAGDKIVTLVINDTANQNRSLVFNSKENTGNFPQLVITADTINRPVPGHNIRPTMPIRLAETTPSCDDTTAVTRPTLPMELANAGESSKVYPNPVHKKFNLFLAGGYARIIDLQVVDALGKTINLGERQLRTGQRLLPVDISGLGLKPAVYFLRIVSDEKSELIKILVQ